MRRKQRGNRSLASVILKRAVAEGLPPSTHLLPAHDGTHLTSYTEKPRGSNALHTFATGLVYSLMRKKLLRDYEASMDRLKTLVETDAAGRTIEALAV